MSTINGVGTRYYGRRDAAPGTYREENVYLAGTTYIATEWVVLLYLPIIPIRSHRLLKVSDNETGLTRTRQYKILDKVQLQWRQVGLTYLAGWGPPLLWTIVALAMGASSEILVAVLLGILMIEIVVGGLIG